MAIGKNPYEDDRAWNEEWNYDPYKFSAADQEYMTPEEKDTVTGWRIKTLNGEMNGSDSHYLTEHLIREPHGYSGGDDGSGYIPLTLADGTEQFSYENAPEWASRKQTQIDALTDELVNRGAFTWNPATDPLYGQMQASYDRSGQRAMQNTLAQVSARTGGMASSYAGTAAQQAYNNYMQQFADRVPELYQLAYNMWQDQGDEQRQNIALLQGQDNIDYSRYRDAVGDWSADRAFANDQYWANLDYNLGVKSDAEAAEQKAKTDARAQIEQMIAAGRSIEDIPDYLITNSGLSNGTLQAMIDQQSKLDAESQKAEQEAGTEEARNRVLSYITAMQGDIYNGTDADGNPTIPDDIMSLIMQSGYSMDEINAIIAEVKRGIETGPDTNLQNRIMEAISKGANPNEFTDEELAAAGLDRRDIWYQYQYWLNQNNLAGYYPSPMPGTGSNSAGMSGSGWDNGSLTPEQVAEIQRSLGVTDDGMWGPNTTAAAGGLTADEAWEKWVEGTLLSGLGSPSGFGYTGNPNAGYGGYGYGGGGYGGNSGGYSGGGVYGIDYGVDTGTDYTGDYTGTDYSTPEPAAMGPTGQGYTVARMRLDALPPTATQADKLDEIDRMKAQGQLEPGEYNKLYAEILSHP